MPPRAGLALGAGAFADRFGLRMVYLFGTTTYLVSMACLSLSPTLQVLVGFRVLQALGTGCLYSTAPAIAASVFPEHRRGLSMGFTSASLALGMVTSTLGAGPLIQLFDWPAVFAGRLHLAGLALLIGLFSIPRTLGNQPTDVAKPRFDLPGSALVLALLLCLMIGLRLGQAIGWTSIPVLTLLAASPPILIALIRVERAAVSPVLPGALVRLSGFQTAVGAMFLGHFSQFVIWFIFPFYITDALGRGPVTLGIMLAVMSTSNILSSPVGGWLCDRWGVRPVGAGRPGHVRRRPLRHVDAGRQFRRMACRRRHRGGGSRRRLVPVRSLRPDAGNCTSRALRHRIGRDVPGAGLGNRPPASPSSAQSSPPSATSTPPAFPPSRILPAGLPRRLPHRRRQPLPLPLSPSAYEPASPG